MENIIKRGFLIGIPISAIGLIIGILNIMEIFSKYFSEQMILGIWIAIGFLMFGLGLAIIVFFIGKTSEDSEKSRYCIKCGRSIPWDINICPYCEQKYA